ncbi:hypothetical protein BC939DRAFT_78045 [Gamsiella multidivaricata]|uniref:uncharacterized protein n=1 Tax=Gamsiella multidivaricata TaxID=101098 RepID=UPI00221F3249|nr:uncharacterized protein BC939DRAFT_78045 [Gamsiella multidivaricata]KAI7828040.1 hypothetical protein BC939DRAFT_78045 [Gamsiella multidivaricata]
MSEAMRPDRVQLRYKLRKGLLDSVSNTENEDEVIAEPMANPFLERLEDVHKDTQKDSHKDVHKDPENQEHEEIDGLTEAELVLLGRIRRLTETPLEVCILFTTENRIRVYGTFRANIRELRLISSFDLSRRPGRTHKRSTKA